MRIIMSQNAKTLTAELNNYLATATVEAEYGDTTVEGSIVTLAHHGSNSFNPAPCIRENGFVDVEVVGISHFDLDTLGGILSLMGEKPGESFWKLAAGVDIAGPHRLEEIVREVEASEKDVEHLHAFWAWNQINRLPRLEPGQVMDVTDHVHTARKALDAIFNDDPDLIEAGRTMKEATSQLETESFLCVSDPGVIVRSSNQFVNHLYTHEGVTAKAVVALNTKFESITVSFENPYVGVSAKDFVQELWGPEAGGHAGIAGSPRGQKMTEGDLSEASRKLMEKLR